MVSIVIRACAQMRELERGHERLRTLPKLGLKITTQTYNSLLAVSTLLLYFTLYLYVYRVVYMPLTWTIV